MHRFHARWIAVSLAMLLSSTLLAQGTGVYQSGETLHIGGEGGWDYLTVDPATHLLYVPRSTHTMVIEAGSGKIVADMGGQKGNHGVAIVTEAGRGFITDGKDGAVVVFDLKTHQVLGKVKTPEDADGVIYDPASKKVMAVCGDAGVLVPISPDVDPKEGKADAAIDLGGKPESLAADGKGKVYVDLEDKGEIAVIDTHEMKVVAHWAVAEGSSPVGLAIDSERGRLFVGCRKPQKMIVMSCEDGKVLAELPIGAGVDAAQFDDGYAVASCRDGTLTVIKEGAPEKFEVVQTVQTKPGARTCGVDTATHTVYLPTAEFEPAVAGQRRPKVKPDTFMVLSVHRD